MVKSVDFAVRDYAGGVTRGNVAGDNAGNFIAVAADDEISLNLRKENILKFEHVGNDLQITLVDGRVITLSGYFAQPEGHDAQLYISADGQLAAVNFEDMGDGVLFANYGEAEIIGKWSPNDQLAFLDGEEIVAPYTDDDTTGMAAFAPVLLGGMGSAGLAGAGLVGLGLLGGGGGGGGNGGEADPTVDEPEADTTLTTNTPDPAATVTGTGEPGSTVVVTLGDQTLETEIGEDGTWGVTFEDDSFPSDGDLTSVVVVTSPSGVVTELDGPDFLIDMTPPDVAVTEGAGSTGDVENLAEYADGISVSGTGEAGASIVVEVAGQTQTTTVDGTGNWTVTFTQDQLPGGTYTEAMTITATDINGNTTTLTDTLVVDTEPHPIGFNSVTADNVVSLAEQSGGVTVTGTSTPGATLQLTLGTTTVPVTVGADGSWSHSFTATQVGTGTRDVTITATTTDAAGNTSSASHSFHLDTEGQVAFSSAPVTADNIVNATEASSVTLTGTSEAGTTSVMVAINGQTLPATVAADGSWSVSIPAAGFATGSYTATVTALDAYGNSSTATRAVTFDMETSVAINPGQAGGDNLITAAERTAAASGGMALTGTAEPGASVAVTFNGYTHTVTANGAGQWSATFTQAQLPSGTGSATVSVVSTDLAGNTASASQVIGYDTEVQNFIHGTQTANTQIADNVVNAAEGAGGLVVTGTVEAGSSVMVQLGSGTALAATVTGTSWSVTIPNSMLPGVETDNMPLKVTATDANGNVAVQTSSVDFDPLVTGFAQTNTIAGDNVVNATEAAAGFTISGTVEAGSSVVLRLNGVDYPATVSGTGWSVALDADALGATAGTVAYTVTATDAAGNVAVLGGNNSLAFSFDLEAPDAPEISAVTLTSNTENVRAIYASADGEGDFAISAVAANGTVSDVALSTDPVSLGSEDLYAFASPVPNGSYLVVADADAAGNEAATLLVVDNNASVAVDLNRAGLQEFDFASIDLSFAEAGLTITEEQIMALTGPDHTLVIHGDGADQVTALGAVDTGQTTLINGQSHSIYTLGDDGATLIIDDQITHLTI